MAQRFEMPRPDGLASGSRGWEPAPEAAPDGAAQLCEEPFVLPAGAGRLYGVRYRPASSPPAAPGWVFCDPLDNEAEWSIRFHVRLARRLAAAGRTVLRFDYRGTGNSSGDFAGVSFDTLLDDVGAAAAEVRRLAPGGGASLLGARFGSVVALLFAARREPVSELVLLDPVLDVQRYFKTVFVDREILSRKLAGEPGGQIRRGFEQSLATEGCVELGGLPFSRRFHDELRGFPGDDLLRPRYRRGLIAVPEARRTAVERQALEALAAGGWTVRHLPVRRGLSGWGAESFSTESPLAPALEAAVLELAAPAAETEG